MIIRNLDGEELYEDSQITIRRTVEAAISKGIPLPKANFRRANLRYALLDGLRAEGACFWGAKLGGADMADAFLPDADFRSACLEDVCLAGADVSGADFNGAFFKQTLLEETKTAGASFSGGSLFDCDLSGVAGLDRAFYVCEDGYKIEFLQPPVIINGLSKRLVLIGGHILWGRKLYGPKGNSRTIPREVRAFAMNFIPTSQKNLSLRAQNPKS